MGSSYGSIRRKTSPKMTAFGHFLAEVVQPMRRMALTCRRLALTILVSMRKIADLALVIFILVAGGLMAREILDGRGWIPHHRVTPAYIRQNGWIPDEFRDCIAVPTREGRLSPNVGVFGGFLSCDAEDHAKEDLSLVIPHHLSIISWGKITRSQAKMRSQGNCGEQQGPSDKCVNSECSADLKKVKSSLAGLRFHDLLHNAITELAESQASDSTVMAIAGHVSPKMLAHYSHVRIRARRTALDSLSTKQAERANSGGEKGGYPPQVVENMVELVGLEPTDLIVASLYSARTRASLQFGNAREAGSDNSPDEGRCDSLACGPGGGRKARAHHRRWLSNIQGGGVRTLCDPLKCEYPALKPVKCEYPALKPACL
jgi:hypothetical protein